MKPLLVPLILGLSLSTAAIPAQAFSVDTGGMMPTLTYPDTTPKPVTQDQGGGSK